METTFCQSCGMPVVAKERFGTNSDSSLYTLSKSLKSFSDKADVL